jgi:hypothetical protein
MHPDQVDTLDHNLPIWGNMLSPLQALCSYKALGAELRELHDDSLPPEELEEAILLDIDVICARLFLITTNPEQYKILLNLQSDQAQTMIDLLQTVSCHLPQPRTHS